MIQNHRAQTLRLHLRGPEVTAPTFCQMNDKEVLNGRNAMHRWKNDIAFISLTITYNMSLREFWKVNTIISSFKMLLIRL